jgi:hypothetical protein
MVSRFTGFSSDALKRIYDSHPEQRAEVGELLARRETHFCMDSALSYLRSLAKKERTAGYKDFTDHCTYGRSWGQLHRQVAHYLEEVQLECERRRWPLLSALIVSADTGTWGEGFFESLVRRGVVSEDQHPLAVEKAERAKCFEWAKSTDE